MSTGFCDNKEGLLCFFVACVIYERMLIKLKPILRPISAFNKQSIPDMSAVFKQSLLNISLNLLIIIRFLSTTSQSEQIVFILNDLLLFCI